jgi:hypothetical protein
LKSECVLLDEKCKPSINALQEKTHKLDSGFQSVLDRVEDRVHSVENCFFLLLTLFVEFVELVTRDNLFVFWQLEHESPSEDLVTIITGDVLCSLITFLECFQGSIKLNTDCR